MNESKQLNTADQSFYSINRGHKDCLFRTVFQEKEDLLELYNAINDTDYQDPDALTVYTLEDAVYMGIKNDLSFLVGGILSLYEHQSTRNPNMPMRGLLYLARNFEAYTEQNGLKKLLVKCRAEVRNMVLSSFDKELYERDLRAESEARGEARGKIEGEAIGKIKGEAIGEVKKLIKQICKKLERAESPESIANALEEDLTVIQKICDAAEQSKKTEGYDINDIFEKISS